MSAHNAPGADGPESRHFAESVAVDPADIFLVLREADERMAYTQKGWAARCRLMQAALVGLVDAHIDGSMCAGHPHITPSDPAPD